jgi:hypothetical protein
MVAQALSRSAGLPWFAGNGSILKGLIRCGVIDSTVFVVDARNDYPVIAPALTPPPTNCSPIGTRFKEALCRVEHQRAREKTGICVERK